MLRINNDLSEYSNMQSQVLGDGAVDWIQVGKLVTAQFSTHASDVSFPNAPAPYLRSNQALPILMRQTTDGVIVNAYIRTDASGYLNIHKDGTAVCSGIITYISAN